MNHSSNQRKTNKSGSFRKKSPRRSYVRGSFSRKPLNNPINPIGKVKNNLSVESSGRSTGSVFYRLFGKKSKSANYKLPSSNQSPNDRNENINEKRNVLPFNQRVKRLDESLVAIQRDLPDELPAQDTSSPEPNNPQPQSAWNNPRVSGLVAAVLLLAMLVTAAWSSVSSAKAGDDALEVRANGAQTGTMQLAKEYIYAGSRMLAIEDYGLGGGSTTNPTPTPTGTPPCGSNFSDDFNDGVRSGFWSLYQASSVASPVYERNGVLEIDGILDPNQITDAGYVSNCAYSPIGSTVTAQIISPTTANGSGGNYAIIGYKDTDLTIKMTYNYIYYRNSGAIYDANRDKWVRIRDDAATEKIYFESSPDGVNWEVRDATISTAGGNHAYYQGIITPLLLSNGTLPGWTSKDDVKYDNFSYSNVANPTTPTPTPTVTPVPVASAPTGRLDSVTVASSNTVEIKGWSFDPSNSNASNFDFIYIDGPIGTGTLVGSVIAFKPRPDVNSLQNITGDHGFVFNLNASNSPSYFDGNQHSVYVYTQDLNGNNNTLLYNAPLTFQAGVATTPTPTPTVTPTPNPTPNPLPLPTAGNYYQVISKLSGKCADVSGGNSATNDGASLQQWDCVGNTGGNQLWQFVPSGDAYQVIAYHSGKCMDVAGVSTSDGAGVQQYTCIGSSQTNQLWKLVQVGDAFQLVAKHSDKCLDVVGGSSAVNNGDSLDQYSCFGASATNQLWTLTQIAPASPTPESYSIQVSGTPHNNDNGISVNWTSSVSRPSGTDKIEVSTNNFSSIVAYTMTGGGTNGSSFVSFNVQPGLYSIRYMKDGTTQVAQATVYVSQ